MKLTLALVAAGKNLDKYIVNTVATSGDVYVGAEFDAIHIDSITDVSHKDLITPELEEG